jgi:hypothetical protein
MKLRDERHGSDSWHLWADLEPGQGLVIKGQDIGPSCPGGVEYEYRFRVPEDRIPVLLDLLGAGPGESVMAVLQQLTGEDITRFATIAKGISTDFWSHWGW